MVVLLGAMLHLLFCTCQVPLSAFQCGPWVASCLTLGFQIWANTLHCSLVLRIITPFIW